MTKPNDNPADPFKKALAEATKTLANAPDLNVSFTVDPSGVSDEAMRLPQVTRRMTAGEVLLARGTADAYAMKLRFHSDATHNKYAPQGEIAKSVYESLETARCEALGARALPGTAKNIDAKIESEALQSGFDKSPALATRHLAPPLAICCARWLPAATCPRQRKTFWDCATNFWATR